MKSKNSLEKAQKIAEINYEMHLLCDDIFNCPNCSLALKNRINQIIKVGQAQNIGYAYSDIDWITTPDIKDVLCDECKNKREKIIKQKMLLDALK